MKNIEIIHQYGRVYSETPDRTRVASRAFLINDGKILLSHELNTEVYLIPGGGAEKNETAEECCIREIREDYFYSLLSHGRVGGEYIVKSLIEKSKKEK